MRIGIIPESLWERLLLRLGLVPTPLADTHMAFLQARAIMTASEVGLWDAIDAGARQPGEIAAACGVDVGAAHKLLCALAAGGYLRTDGSTFTLSAGARRWLVSSSRQSIDGKMAFQRDEWGMIERMTDFVRSGDGVDMHDHLTGDGWRRYQAGMSDLARLSAPEIARRLPVPRGATRVLDLGGGHGVLAAAICARQPGLRAHVVDMPAAIDGAAERLQNVPGADHVTFQGGDLRAMDLGESAYDIILMANVAHHLGPDENADVAIRASRALRTGGVFAVVEWMRPEVAGRRRSANFGALLDLYFALTSRSGTWSVEEVSAWQRYAGLEPTRPRWLRTLPGAAILCATK